MRETISCAIVVLNEERNIHDCLESAKWMDEIVLVDARSKDRTVEIAREYTERIFTRSWNGFGEQKNFAIDQATNDWVFVLDADERICSDLRREIEGILTSRDASGLVAYCLPRKNYFYGRWLRWGGTYPDYQLRLFRKGIARYNDVPIHENLLVEGRIGTLTGHLDHYTERRIEDHFRKFSLYTSLAAENKRKSQQVVSWYNLLVNPLVVFTKTYVLKQGFRDGIRGLIVATFASMYTFVKYAKLWESLQERKAVGGSNTRGA